MVRDTHNKFAFHWGGEGSYISVITHGWTCTLTTTKLSTVFLPWIEIYKDRAH